MKNALDSERERSDKQAAALRHQEELIKGLQERAAIIEKTATDAAESSATELRRVDEALDQRPCMDVFNAAMETMSAIDDRVQDLETGTESPVAMAMNKADEATRVAYTNSGALESFREATEESLAKLGGYIREANTEIIGMQDRVKLMFAEQQRLMSEDMLKMQDEVSDVVAKSNAACKSVTDMEEKVQEVVSTADEDRASFKSTSSDIRGALAMSNRAQDGLRSLIDKNFGYFIEIFGCVD